MADNITFTWKVNNVPKVLKALDGAIDLGLDTWAADTIQAADDAAPVQTGGLRASRYRVSGITDEYDSAVAAFLAANPKGQPGSHPGKLEHGVILGFAADYAAAVNDGHHTRSGSFVAANPFFTDTVESRLAEIRTALRAAFDKLIGK